MSTTRREIEGEKQLSGLPHVTIVKCPCGQCSTYSISYGKFYQGCGWDKEEAQFIADAINEKSAKAQESVT